eukprot:TRINITY_DN132_c0_g1_i1.p1 TRINITY_DN132_c0_g1~~TRINITY_DN132_c0_g1_i1.p1  ORF type:complete len:614 (-),score=249.88 TRINITY_DN132_c0_g1_i1:133-1974(-)
MKMTFRCLLFGSALLAESHANPHHHWHPPPDGWTTKMLDKLAGEYNRARNGNGKPKPHWKPSDEVSMAPSTAAALAAEAKKKKKNKAFLQAEPASFVQLNPLYVDKVVTPWMNEALDSESAQQEAALHQAQDMANQERSATDIAVDAARKMAKSHFHPYGKVDPLPKAEVMPLVYEGQSEESKLQELREIVKENKHSWSAHEKDWKNKPGAVRHIDIVDPEEESASEKALLENARRLAGSQDADEEQKKKDLEKYRLMARLNKDKIKAWRNRHHQQALDEAKVLEKKHIEDYHLNDDSIEKAASLLNMEEPKKVEQPKKFHAFRMPGHEEEDISKKLEEVEKKKQKRQEEANVADPTEVKIKVKRMGKTEEPSSEVAVASHADKHQGAAIKLQRASKKKDEVAGKSDDKDKVAEKSDDKEEVAEKSDDKDKVAEKSNDKDKVAEKSDDKEEVAEKSDDKDKVAEKSNDKDKVAEKSDDKDKKVEKESKLAHKILDENKRRIAEEEKALEAKKKKLAEEKKALEEKKMRAAAEKKALEEKEQREKAEKLALKKMEDDRHNAEVHHKAADILAKIKAEQAKEVKQMALASKIQSDKVEDMSDDEAVEAALEVGTQ